MIQIIEAPPRSGKSYFAVNYLCKFCCFDELYHEYILNSDVLIISNIEGLKINHWKLDECLKKKSLEEFFSISNFENIMEKTGKRHVIICIDECHEIFPCGFMSNPIYEFFAYHGHIGLDIILMCQSLDRTSRMFNPLLEYVVKVTPRSRSVLNNFSYQFVDIRGKYLYSRSLKKRKLIFNAYKSFRKDEQNKPKNAVYHWMIITLVFFIVAGFSFKGALAIVKGKASAHQKPQKVGYLPQGAVIPSSPSVPPALSPGDGSVVTKSQSFNNISSNTSSNTSSSSKAVTVLGFASRGLKRRYLLSDGRTVSSVDRLAIGDTYQNR